MSSRYKTVNLKPSVFELALGVAAAEGLSVPQWVERAILRASGEPTEAPTRPAPVLDHPPNTDAVLRTVAGRGELPFRPQPKR